MITTCISVALFITSVPVFADTLVVGSIYFDSEQTLKEVINLSAQHDNEGIAKLIQNGHISDQTREEKDIVVLISGSTPESPAEFRFLNGPTTYWNMTKYVANLAKLIPTPTPYRHQPQHPYLLDLQPQHRPLSMIVGNMKAMFLLTTITVSAFGIKSMVNGNGILLIDILYQ